LTDVSEVLAASIIRVMRMIEAVSTSERRSISTRLHGARSKMIVIFILAAVRT
jgi:hypothetical protein